MVRVFNIDGGKVRELRERAGMDQPTLAARVGIKQPTLSQIETGKRNTKPEITLKIAEALGVTFDDITERIAS